MPTKSVREVILRLSPLEAKTLEKSATRCDEALHSFGGEIMGWDEHETKAFRRALKMLRKAQGEKE